MKYLILDFDNTLFNKGDCEADLNNKLDLLSKKYEIIIATGRSYDNFTDYFDINNIKKYVYGFVFSNGSVTIKDDEVKKYYFNKDDILKMLSLFINTKDFRLEVDGDGYYEYSAWINSDCKDNVTKIRLMIDNKYDAIYFINLSNLLGFSIIIDSIDNIDVYPRNINKLNSSLNLIDNYESQDITAIGDGANDLSFICNDSIHGRLIKNHIIQTKDNLCEILQVEKNLIYK